MPTESSAPQSTSPELRESEWRLPSGPRSAGRARELLRTQLAEWQVDGDAADTAELLLPELTSNAVRHARTPPGRQIGVRIALYEGRLRVEVADADTRPPTARTVPVDSTEGRGLGIVGVLAVRWGWCPRRHGIGKAVWAEVQLPAATTDELTPEVPGAPTSDVQAAALTPDAWARTSAAAPGGRRRRGRGLTGPW
ncbi:ATP-binding protein [Streptomyces thermospinosisporus]|uniref:ATP-binding protein n=1 Tax=Streptomyces thermospinosisporus TaxID=161482 RepID=A0ABN1YJH5_9ACTN